MSDLSQFADYRGSGVRPADFDDFWARGLQQVAALDPAPKETPVAIPSNVAAPYDLWFTGIDGARLHAQLIRPKHFDPAVPHKGLLLFHGYHCDAGDFTDKFGWAAEGFVVLALDCPGQGGLSEDVTATRGGTLKGLIVRGIEEGPENLYYRRVFLDVALAARLLGELPGVDAKRLYAMGGSQGGGLTLALLGLVPTIHRAVVYYPFLSDYRKAYALGAETNGYDQLAYWFRYRDPLHEHEAEFFDALEYIDVSHFARRIQTPLIWGMGLADQVVPLATQFAGYNQLTGEKKLITLPEYGHEFLPKFADRTRGFFMD
ncbi:acetylxylan esterase [Lacticaseibacillus kribbianus]|uniref:acetylxylan esterase n=1 Tax=Lacticaseibacillus kribbianus TaxID=2926292 RepID=UPI001CD4CA90|nr:acetylxylan esterase [Lacticaseibacillus kribbianus]